MATAIGGLILVVLLDCGLRLYNRLAGRPFDSPIVPHDSLGYALEPHYRGSQWSTDIALDGHGLRNARPLSRPERVLNLGDSSTFGVAVDEPDTYSSRLFRSLDQRWPGRFDVVNAGVPGYSTREGRLLVTGSSLLERVEPSIVTLYYGWNDHWYRKNEAAPTGGWRQRLADLSVLARTLRRVRVKRSQQLAARHLDSRRGELRKLIDDPRSRQLEAFDTNQLNVPPAALADNLRQIIGTIRDSGAEVVLMVPPFEGPEALVQVLERYPTAKLEPYLLHGAYQELLRSFATEHRVPVLELPAVFEHRQAASIQNIDLYADPIHPNAEGHRLVAEHLMAHLSTVID